MYYKVKVQHVVLTEKMTNKVQTERWLVEGENLIDAITKAEKKAATEGLNETVIGSATTAPFREVIMDGAGGEGFFESIIVFIMTDEARGIEKREKYHTMVMAADIDAAKSTIERVQSECVHAWELNSLKASEICAIA